MKLTPEQVEHIATLARLSLTEDEKTLFGKQLSSVLDYVDALAKANVDGVVPMHHIADVHNVFGDDVVSACDAATRDALIAAFPEREADLLKVKAVFS